MLRRFLAAAFIALVPVTLVISPIQAARELTSLFGGKPAPVIRYEILVFERESCAYCEVFRDNIAARYKATAHAATMPMRFIDIDKADTDALGLKSQLTMLPTAVVMKDGAEVDRVPGLVAPNTFFALVQHILNGAE